MDEFARRLLTSLESDSFDGIAEVLDAVEGLGLAEETTRQIEERAIKTPGSDVGVRILALANTMSQAADDLASAIGSANYGR